MPYPRHSRWRRPIIFLSSGSPRTSSFHNSDKACRSSPESCRLGVGYFPPSPKVAPPIAGVFRNHRDWELATPQFPRGRQEALPSTSIRTGPPDVFVRLGKPLPSSTLRGNKRHSGEGSDSTKSPQDEVHKWTASRMYPGLSMQAYSIFAFGVMTPAIRQ